MIMFSSLDFDIAFGAYQDIDPKYGKVSASHLTKTRVVDPVTGELSIQLSRRYKYFYRCKLWWERSWTGKMQRWAF